MVKEFLSKESTNQYRICRQPFIIKDLPNKNCGRIASHLKTNSTDCEVTLTRERLQGKEHLSLPHSLG